MNGGPMEGITTKVHTKGTLYIELPKKLFD